jgi:hypothetical protein
MNLRTASALTSASQGAMSAGMIFTAGQYSFWYFGYPTPLAPAEDRSA